MGRRIGYVYLYNIKVKTYVLESAEVGLQRFRKIGAVIFYFFYFFSTFTSCLASNGSAYFGGSWYLYTDHPPRVDNTGGGECG